MRTWINKRLTALGKTKAELARRLDVPFARVSEMINGKRNIQPSEIEAFAKFLDMDASKVVPFFEGAPIDFNEPSINITKEGNGGTSAKSGWVQVPEYDLQVSAGGGLVVDDENIKDEWPFKVEYLTHELRVEPNKLSLVEVKGDSMEPTLSTGDRVMIDTQDKNISQPGIFVAHDGDGTVVKRIEKVYTAEVPTIALISDNQRHSRYEIPAHLVVIIGRVIWAGRKM